MSAIQSDVQQEEVKSNEQANPVEEVKDEKDPAPLSPREQAMEALSAKRNEEVVAEMREGGQIPDPVEPAEPEVDQVAAQMEADKPTVLSDGLDKTMVKIKVDGVESEVSVAEMQRNYQVNQAADKRMAEATRLMREAQEAQIKNQTEKPSGMGNNPNEAEAPQPQGVNAGKEFLSALYADDEEKALEAFNAAVNAAVAGRQTPTLNEAELAQKLAPAIKQQLDVDSALVSFQKDYADIVADPYLASRADAFLKAELEAGNPFDKAMKAAGDKTRDWLREKAGVKTAEPTPTISRTEKLDRKSGIDELPGTTLKATQVVEPQQTASDVISQMRKDRGLM